MKIKEIVSKGPFTRCVICRRVLRHKGKNTRVNQSSCLHGETGTVGNPRGQSIGILVDKTLNNNKDNSGDDCVVTMATVNK